MQIKYLSRQSIKSKSEGLYISSTDITDFLRNATFVPHRGKSLPQRRQLNAKSKYKRPFFNYMGYLIALTIINLPLKTRSWSYEPQLESHRHQTTHKRQNLLVSMDIYIQSLPNEHELE